MGNNASKCSCKSNTTAKKQESQPAVPASVVPVEPTREDLLRSSVLEDWQIVRQLGKGAFGVVNLVIHKTRPELVAAMKVVPIRDADPAKPLRHCTDPNNEWKEMQRLHHVHIVQCYRAWRVEHTRSLHILLEYVAGPDLGHFLGNVDRVDDETIGRIFVQLLSALWYMEHINDCGGEKRKGMCHRDLKPENILLSSRDYHSASAKITDFGFARTLPEASGISTDLSTCGTPPYMAPERLRKLEYGCPSDIWSLGLILVEMITKQHLFSKYRRNLNELREAQLYVSEWLQQMLSEEYLPLTDLILGMLAFDAESRWTPEKIAEHPWVRHHMHQNGIELKVAANTDGAGSTNLVEV